MALSGTVASVAFGSTPTALPAVGTVTVSFNTPAIDVTPIGSTAQQYIAGAIGATGSLDIFYDQTNTAHGTLDGYVAARTFNNWVITLGNTQTITGSAVVTGYEITAQAQGVCRASISLQFDGAPVIA